MLRPGMTTSRDMLTPLVTRWVGHDSDDGHDDGDDGHHDDDDGDDGLIEVADKLDYNRHNREYDEEQQKQHFQSWETFWGRPGYGAPREVLISFYVHLSLLLC